MSQSTDIVVSPEKATEFWSKVHRHYRRPDGCWVWLGAMDDKGYGRFSIGGKDRRSYGAHRVAYVLVVGPIPAGLQLDHLCRRPECVNPRHLEPVTQRINQLRGDTIMAHNIAKTHCPRGHPYSGRNLRITQNGGRACRKCAVIATLASRKRRLGQPPIRLPKTHCQRGHPFSGDNLYIVPSTGLRQCRTCHKAAVRNWHERKRKEQLGDSQ